MEGYLSITKSSPIDTFIKDQVDDILKCPKCEMQIKDPRMLPCQHSFCTNCIWDIIRNGSQKCLLCPILFDLPANSVHGLPKNIILERILDLFYPERSAGGRGYVKFLKNALQWQLPLLLQQPLLAPNASPDSSSTSTSSSPSPKENGNASDNEDIEVTIDANDVAKNSSCKTDEGYKSLQEVLYENKVYLQSKVKNCSYYWPKITRVEAEKLLKDQPNGYFLLRDSSDKKVAFCLTYKIFMTDDITSIKMFKTGNGFQFEGDNLVVVEAFESPMKLIDHFVNGNEPRSNLNHLKMPFLRRNPLSLKDLSNAVVRESVTYCNIEKLPIPIELQNYIKEN